MPAQRALLLSSLLPKTMSAKQLEGALRAHMHSGMGAANDGKSFALFSMLSVEADEPPP